MTFEKDVHPGAAPEQDIGVSPETASCAVNKASKPCGVCESGHRLKAQFLSVMSHELLTPLNGIIGMTELAMDTRLDGEQREMITMAHRSALDLLKIIQDMLTLAAINAGHISSVHARISVNALVTLLHKEAEKPASERGLSLQFDLEPGLPHHVSADIAQLRTVLTILVSNAIKFTPKGGITIRIKRHGEGLRITVEDTGIGIAKERLESIFDPFSQVDAGLARNYGGLGIGLSIARRLVELMGGGLYVESELGQGSRFHVLLP